MLRTAKRGEATLALLARSRLAAAVSAADPQRRLVPRPRPSRELLAARLRSDLRALGLGLRLLPLALRRPALARLALHLALEFPPGRAYRLARAAGDELFGETPLWSAVQILQDAGVRPGQRLAELGSGPGRLGLVAATLFGMRCEAIERVAAFVRGGNRVARRLGLPVSYREQDLLRWAPAAEDWVYVAGTAYSGTLREALGKRLTDSACSVLSVTAPLPIHGHLLAPLGRYPFLWGPERVYLQSPS